jgi:hypothetical protein
MFPEKEGDSGRELEGEKDGRPTDDPPKYLRAWTVTLNKRVRKWQSSELPTVAKRIGSSTSSSLLVSVLMNNDILLGLGLSSP